MTKAFKLEHKTKTFLLVINGMYMCILTGTRFNFIYTKNGVFSSRVNNTKAAFKIITTKSRLSGNIYNSI